MRTDGSEREGFRFDSVRVELDGQVILDSIDLVLPFTGVTVIAGPSGAGKSTLLRLCNRLEVPTSGRVLLDGDDIARLPPTDLRRHVAMVFQRPVPFAGTVLDNLLVAEPDATPTTCEDALVRVGLDPSLMDRRADDLSGGEAQRMCLARTLLTEPEIVLMDEPTSALDLESTIQIEALSRQLADDGVAILWVTHDLAQIERIADRTIVLAAGRVAVPEASARYLEGRMGSNGTDRATDEEGEPS